jgi:SAM-dependent methyltransferase
MHDLSALSKLAGSSICLRATWIAVSRSFGKGKVDQMSELDAVAERYARRELDVSRTKYEPTSSHVHAASQERSRGIISVLRAADLLPIRDLKILEVGCGGGQNLLELIQLGADPTRLLANELLLNRVEVARSNLPIGVLVLPGDARAIELEPGCLDIVYQSTVFSSILDGEFQQDLARAMWRWVRPGGGILWYDFLVNNPRNQDVIGVSKARVRELFPSADVFGKRVTLAPPIARWLGRSFLSYQIASSFRPARTHWVGLLRKPLTSADVSSEGA